MIIAIIAITKGMNEVVKASLTGSIIGNLLLVGGGAMLVGGWSRKEQSFSKAAAETFGGLLLLATAAMLVPAIFHYSAERHHDPNLQSHELSVSLGTSVILLLIYLAGLLFTLRTHAYLFSPPPKEQNPTHLNPPTGEAKSAIRNPQSAMETPWSISKSLTYLLLASVGVGFVAELLVGAAEQTAEHLGWSPIFVGVILLAIIGNAAEHSTALLLAKNDDMDTALTVSFQSSLQIALFAVPVLVFTAYAFHAFGIGKSEPLDLLFTPLEVVAVLLTVLVTILLCLNGKTNWFEGAILLALYAILALAFFNIPSHEHTATTLPTP
jgi:Ca2+:H+ antiporter